MYGRYNIAKFLEVEASELRPLITIGEVIKIIDKPDRLKDDLEKLKKRKDEAAKEETRRMEEQKRKTYYGGRNPLD